MLNDGDDEDAHATAPLNLTEASADELRNEWRTRWHPKTQALFCTTYNINQGNFSSWLSGKLASSPASVDAIKAYLLEQPEYRVQAANKILGSMLESSLLDDCSCELGVAAPKWKPLIW